MFTVNYIFEYSVDKMKFNTYEEAHNTAMDLWFIGYLVGFELFNENGKLIEINGHKYE